MCVSRPAKGSSPVEDASRFPRAHARGTKTVPPHLFAFLCWLASRVPVVFFHGCWNLLSSHGEPGTRLRVREAHTAGYPLAGGDEGATRAPLIVSSAESAHAVHSCYFFDKEKPRQPWRLPRLAFMPCDQVKEPGEVTRDPPTVPGSRPHDPSLYLSLLMTRTVSLPWVRASFPSC